MIDPALIGNPLKRRLQSHGVATMMSLRQLRTPEAAMIVRSCGFDGFYVDREHGMYSDGETAALCSAGLMMGLMPAVRVRANTPAEIAGALDAGALAVIVPHVGGPGDAERAVRSAKFPPRGDRSVAALAPATRYRAMPLAESMRLADDIVMVFAMLETPEGVANAEAIAGIDGIDALMIGPTDLSAALGVPGAVREGPVRDAYLTAAAAARKHGKHFVAGGAGGPDAAEMAQHGARIFMGGTDVAYLIAAAKASAASLREAAQSGGAAAENRGRW